MAGQYAKELKDACKRLPKLELHAHLNGSISSSTMRKLVERYRQTLQQSSSDCNVTDGWTTTIQKGNKRTLKECFAMFKIIHTIVCDEEAVTMVAHDVVCDFAADGVIYLELRSTPRCNPSTGMTKISYIEAVWKGVEQAVAESNSSIDVRLLLSIDRSRGAADALDTVELAKEYRMSSPTNIVGIDFSGNPEVGKVCELLPALKHAKESGLKVSIHLAEVPNVSNETSLLLSLPPDRIGHGTFLLPSTGGSIGNMELVTKYKIPIELCLTSNVKCHTVPSYDEHQFGFWNERAHPIVICTDDKGIFSTTLSEEYQITAQTFGLSISDIRELSKQAVDYVFDEGLKTKLREKQEV